MPKSTIKLRDWKHKPPIQKASKGEIKRDARGRLVKGTAPLPGAGHPRGVTLGDAARRKLKQYVNDRVDSPTWAELIVDVIVNEGAVRRNKDAWSALIKLTETSKLEIIDPRAALQKRLAELGLSINDIRDDPIAAEFFRFAGIDVATDAKSAGSDSGDEE